MSRINPLAVLFLGTGTAWGHIIANDPALGFAFASTVILIASIFMD